MANQKQRIRRKLLLRAESKLTMIVDDDPLRNGKETDGGTLSLATVRTNGQEENE